jgi:hypothetical protein
MGQMLPDRPHFILIEPGAGYRFNGNNELDLAILIPDKEENLTVKARNRSNVSFGEHEKNVAK